MMRTDPPHCRRAPGINSFSCSIGQLLALSSLKLKVADHKLGQVWVSDVQPAASKMALSLEPPTESRPQESRESAPRKQATKKGRDQSGEGPKQITATSSNVKKAKAKGNNGARSLAGGLSALGSALSGAGYKGRAQLDREAEKAKRAESASESQISLSCSCLGKAVQTHTTHAVL